MMHLTNQQLYDKIATHLASGGVVVVQTCYRYTEYKSKHAALFSVASESAGSGVWVARGRSKDFVMPQYLRFGRYVTA